MGTLKRKSYNKEKTECCRPVNSVLVVNIHIALSSLYRENNQQKKTNPKWEPQGIIHQSTSYSNHFQIIILKSGHLKKTAAIETKQTRRKTYSVTGKQTLEQTSAKTNSAYFKLDRDEYCCFIIIWSDLVLCIYIGFINTIKRSKIKYMGCVWLEKPSLWNKFVKCIKHILHLENLEKSIHTLHTQLYLGYFPQSPSLSAVSFSTFSF